ncbi:MAG: ribonuclease HII [Candidatus Nomurabacteria bacterium]|jgi:ribonuclease HII|nr:ribonuclease HII [Candidatus Nomurabacteria bacterium]
MIMGIDEVGRGAWAGPLVVGAVVLGDAAIDGLDDSKKLTPKKRAKLALEIKRRAAGIGVGWVGAHIIDQIGLSAALKLAARRAVAQINCDYDEIIIDGTIKLIEGDQVSTLPRADGLIAAVSAASIIAKVARDNYMARLDAVFDGYDFAQHVGYGTASHRMAIARRGVLPVHRKSFAPIAEMCASNSPKSASSKTRNTTSIGNSAESVAAEFLSRRGHEIIARNWKTKYCEVDIISRQNDTIYFTEVKYRRSARRGDGLDAITAKKENQMRFAARFWLHEQNLTGQIDARLSVIAMAGQPPRVEKYIKNID